MDKILDLEKKIFVMFRLLVNNNLFLLNTLCVKSSKRTVYTCKIIRSIVWLSILMMLQIIESKVSK